jgi:hypothetical protein
MVEVIEYGCNTDNIMGKERPLFDVKTFYLGDNRHEDEVNQALTYIRNTINDIVVNFDETITVTAYHTWRRKSAQPMYVRIKENSTNDDWIETLINRISQNIINQIEIKIAGHKIPNIYFVRL